MAGRGLRLSTTGGRWEVVDLLKVVAAQVIVWHHLSAYGPVADALHASWPSMLAWLYDHGRMAVQVFLVLGGYLALPGLLAAQQQEATFPASTIAGRYRRLLPSFAIAMLFAMVASTLARPWLDIELAGSAPQVLQLVAHALLLQDIVGVEPLSAGIWYVAVDLQLYAMLALLLWLGRVLRATTWLLALPLLLVAASLLWWNRQPQLDIWAIYFLGAYGLGMMARMARDATYLPERAWWLAGATVLGLLALWVEWRMRLAIALAVAWWLATAPAGLARRWPPALRDIVSTAGQASYALFLLHFPVLLLGNAAWVAWHLQGPLHAWTMAIVIHAVSLGLALLFERHIERRLTFGRRRTG
jgi:peptidoglycan/LPS O-acetylase OafA/YrhL